MSQLRIKEICSEKGISVVELAKRIGMSRVSINNMVAGRQSPPVSTLDKIAEALEVETWELLKSLDEISVKSEEESGVLTCPKCGTKLQLIEVKENEE